MSALGVDVLRETFANAERVRVMKHHEEKCAERKSPIDPIALARVRKNLFAEVEVGPAANNFFIEQELRRVENIEKERWNFDFTNEKPLNDSRGFYTWEAYIKPTAKPQFKHVVAPKPRRIVGKGKMSGKIIFTLTNYS